MNKIWALSVTLPFSAVERMIEAFPEKAAGESAFIVDNDDRQPDPDWIVQGFYKEKPDIAGINMACEVLVASYNGKTFPIKLEQMPATGWVEKNQARYAPMHVERFVIHDAGHRATVAPHKKGIEMEVSCAFGTGEHPTTFGCLSALQKIPRLRNNAHVLDLGTGTGVLAIAAAKLFAAKILASDMDQPSVLVAQENIRKNGLRTRIKAITADGFRSRRIKAGRPYDLILSNIFARPLARFAPEMTCALKPGGYIVLAGFLHRDVNLVRASYMRNGVYLKRALRFGAWSVLILKKR